MKKHNKIILILGIVVCLSIVVWVALIVFLGIGGAVYAHKKLNTNERRSIVLYQTDHETLLESCRQVLRETREGRRKCRSYNCWPTPEDQANNLPQNILKLTPNHIYIYDHYVVIEMAGGVIGHFGIMAFEKQFDQWGDKQLLDGLWYYDDGYKDDPNYDEFIESLRPDG